MTHFLAINNFRGSFYNLYHRERVSPTVAPRTNSESDRSSNRISGRWPEMTSLSCRSRGSERIDSRAALDRR